MSLADVVERLQGTVEDIHVESQLWNIIKKVSLTTSMVLRKRQHGSVSVILSFGIPDIKNYHNHYH